MSILIRGMEMPKTCSDCELYQYGFCMVTRNVCDKAWTQRQDDCPLVEVKEPHGRLVDADAFKETIDYYIREANWSDAHNEALGWAKEFIDNEQAIIEAEGSNT